MGNTNALQDLSRFHLKKCVRSAGGGNSDQLDHIYINELEGVKQILVSLLRNSIPPYMVVWQNQFVLHVTISLTIILRMLKPVVSPTKYKYQVAKIPAILDFNHRSPKLEKTVDCVDGFIYPYHICKIAIFGFISINHRFNDIWLSDKKSQNLKSLIFPKI